MLSAVNTVGGPNSTTANRFQPGSEPFIEQAPEGEWPGDFERLFGSIGDEGFVAPQRPEPAKSGLIGPGVSPTKY
jgi:hypothetical protein